MSWMNQVTHVIVMMIESCHHVIVMMDESCYTCDCDDEAAILQRDDVMDESCHICDVTHLDES